MKPRKKDYHLLEAYRFGRRNVAHTLEDLEIFIAQTHLPTDGGQVSDEPSANNQAGLRASIVANRSRAPLCMVPTSSLYLTRSQPS